MGLRWTWHRPGLGKRLGCAGHDPELCWAWAGVVMWLGRAGHVVRLGMGLGWVCGSNGLGMCLDWAGHRAAVG
jgi:hypothetical protein